MIHVGLCASPASIQVKLRAPTDHHPPFCRNEGPFSPLARQSAHWTGYGHDKHGVLRSVPSDPCAYAPSDPVLISPGPSRHAIPY